MAFVIKRLVLAILFTAFSLIASNAVKAQDDVTPAESSPLSDAKSEVPTKKKKKRKSKKPADTTSSEMTEITGADAGADTEPRLNTANGIRRNIGFGLNVGFIYIGGGGGAETWYSPTKKLDLGLRLLTGSGKSKASGSSGLLETADLKLFNASTNARFFLTESFFILGGIGYSSYSGKYGFTVASTKEEYLIPMTAGAATVSIAIGNMWKTRRGFVVGFDWIGYSYLAGLKAKIADPKTEKERQTIDAIKLVENGGEPKVKAQQLIARQNVYALLMTLGYSF